MYEEEEIDESKLTETQRAMLAAKRKQQAEDEKWFEEYMVEVAEKREQEAAELEELKARIEERRAQRIEEDEQRQEYARQAAERHKQEEEEKKAKLEEAKRKKQAMMAGGMGNVGAAPPKGAGRSFKIVKKQVQAEDGTVTEVEEKVDAAGGPDPHKEALMAKYKQPLDLDDADCTSLRMRIKGLHEQLLHAESARYDLEERVKVQNMDFKELNERNKQQLKKKAQKLGLDPEEFANAKHPPKVKTQNAYDRVIDSRGYEDRKKYYLRQPPPPKAIAHGTARPPPQWGRTYNAEEIQNVRKYLEENPPKYQELEPVEGAKPPVKPIPLKVPEETAEAPPPADEPAAPEPAAAEPAPEAEAEAE